MYSINLKDPHKRTLCFVAREQGTTRQMALW